MHAEGLRALAVMGKLSSSKREAGTLFAAAKAEAVLTAISATKKITAKRNNLDGLITIRSLVEQRRCRPHLMSYRPHHWVL